MDTLNLPEFSQNCKIGSDLMVINIFLGLQSCSSIHPCPYCMGYKINKKGLKTNQKGRFQPGKQRTMGNIRKCNELWGKETIFNRSLLKDYFNVEYPPICDTLYTYEAEIHSVAPYGAVKLDAESALLIVS